MIPAALDTAPHARPVAVGGVGGSGTRLVAGILRDLGFFIGSHLNKANDNLWFTLLFKRAGIRSVDDDEFSRLTRILCSGLSGGSPLDRPDLRLVSSLTREARPFHPVAQLRESARALVRAASRQPGDDAAWAWKEPNTHVVIERLWQRLPSLRYVHVVRNGFDMAYSTNQRQLELWGADVLGSDGPNTPDRALAYWCEVHRRMQRLLGANPGRMYWLDYDALCRNPAPELAGLLAFLGMPPSAGDRLHLDIVAQPPRHTPKGLEGFSADDVDFVRSLGFR